MASTGIGSASSGGGSAVDSTGSDGGQTTPGSESTDESTSTGVENDPCAMIDFLFVIDGSGSMLDEQMALVASLPDFITSFSELDHHVMVVDADALWGGQCEALCPTFGSCPDIPEYPCESGLPTLCDAEMGAGVVYPMAANAANMPCDFSSGARYIDDTEPDLAAAFSCAAIVGTSGDNNERIANATVAAVSDMLIQPGGCNEGFLRDDAKLVVTIITDEDDVTSNGAPEGWLQGVLAAKGGNVDDVVMLALLNDGDQIEPLCAEPEAPTRLAEFVSLFPQQLRGSVCAEDYGPFFDDAFALIESVCTR